ncbi:MAG: MBL fold metallo-hydrolase [Thermoleophilaceae bacterium]
MTRTTVKRADRTYRLGQAQVTAVIDAVIDLPFDLEDFYPDVPLEAWTPWRRRYAETFWAPNRHRVNYAAYVIQQDGLRILVDAGMGPKDAPMSQAVAAVAGERELLHNPHRLLAGLREISIAPEDIDIVVLTHLDPDHVGWALRCDQRGPTRTFPNARYVVHEADWAAFHGAGWDRDAPFEYLPTSVSPLATMDQLQLMSRPVMSLSENVSLRLAAGHTPGHLVAVVQDSRRLLYLLGDALAHPAQISEPSWCSTADRSPDQAIATRLALLDRLERENAVFAASHFPQPYFGRIGTGAGGREWTPDPETR